MKKFLLPLILISANVFAGDFEQIDSVLNSLFKPGVQYFGVDAKGMKCHVDKGGRQVNIWSYAPECEQNPVRCSPQFIYNKNPARMTVKELVIKENYLLAEVKSKDDEQYSGAKTTKIEISLNGRKAKVIISDRKNIFQNYGVVKDCSVNL